MAAFINIIGWPTGAEIFVDNIKIGELPIYYHPLKWGKYKIEAKKEGYEPEMREEFRIFKTDHKKTIVFQLKKIEVE